MALGLSFNISTFLMFITACSWLQQRATAPVRVLPADYRESVSRQWRSAACSRCRFSPVDIRRCRREWRPPRQQRRHRCRRKMPSRDDLPVPVHPTRSTPAWTRPRAASSRRTAPNSSRTSALCTQSRIIRLHFACNAHVTVVTLSTYAHRLASR